MPTTPFLKQREPKHRGLEGTHSLTAGAHLQSIQGSHLPCASQSLTRPPLPRPPSRKPDHTTSVLADGNGGMVTKAGANRCDPEPLSLSGPCPHPVVKRAQRTARTGGSRGDRGNEKAPQRKCHVQQDLTVTTKAREAIR